MFSVPIRKTGISSIHMWWAGTVNQPLINPCAIYLKELCVSIIFDSFVGENQMARHFPCCLVSNDF